MPRSSQSPESKVLAYFNEAELAAVLVVWGLVREIVKSRVEAPVAKVVVPRRKRRAMVAAVGVSAPPAKKSHKKSHKKPQDDVHPLTRAEKAELDDLTA